VKWEEGIDGRRGRTEREKEKEREKGKRLENEDGQRGSAL
jgi:hypothetical protein